jgi:HlyD family secretion protein
VIKTGIQDDSNIEITTGLSEEDVVVIGPYNMVTKILKSGDKIQVASDEEDSNNSNKN